VQEDQASKAIILSSGNNGYTATAVNISHARFITSILQEGQLASSASTSTDTSATYIRSICLVPTSATPAAAQTILHLMPGILLSSTEYTSRAVTTVPLPPLALAPAGAAKQVQSLPTLPSSIPEMVSIVNANLGHKRQAHHITEFQTTSVQRLFGDVSLLLDLAGLHSSLNEAPKADTNLNAIHILAVRRSRCGSSI